MQELVAIAYARSSKVIILTWVNLLVKVMIDFAQAMQHLRKAATLLTRPLTSIEF